MRLVRRGDHPGIIADQKSKVLLKQLTTPYHIHIPTLCNKDGGINYAKGRSHGIRQSCCLSFCLPRIFCHSLKTKRRNLQHKQKLIFDQV